MSDELTLLGAGPLPPTKKLETFANPHPERPYTVILKTGEFTTLCPITRQPDFATIIVRYVPDKRVLESKSFKLYLWTFRDEQTFYEDSVNVILNDLVKALEPRSCEVIGKFNVRGGISITVEASYTRPEDS